MPMPAAIDEIDGMLATLGKSRSGAVAGSAARPPLRVRPLAPVAPALPRGTRLREEANAVEDPPKMLAAFAVGSGAAAIAAAAIMAGGGGSGGGPSDERWGAL